MIDSNRNFVNNTDLNEVNSLTHLIEYLDPIDEGEVNPIHHSNYYNNEEFIEAHKRRHENFPEFRNFHDLRGHSCGNRRSDLIFMGGGGTIYSVCSLSVSNAGTAHHKSSQASGVYTMSILTSRPIYYNSLIFCIVRVCTSLLIFKLSYVTLKQ